MFFYRVRVDSQVYVVSPLMGTDIISHQPEGRVDVSSRAEGWVNVSSAETRNQVRSELASFLSLSILFRLN